MPEPARRIAEAAARRHGVRAPLGTPEIVDGALVSLWDHVPAEPDRPVDFARLGAPPAWDHALLIPWAERYGDPSDPYPDFARGYGTDLRDHPLAGTLAATRGDAEHHRHRGRASGPRRRGSRPRPLLDGRSGRAGLDGALRTDPSRSRPGGGTVNPMLLRA